MCVRLPVYVSVCVYLYAKWKTLSQKLSSDARIAGNRCMKCHVSVIIAMLAISPQLGDEIDVVRIV